MWFDSDIWKWCYYENESWREFFWKKKTIESGPNCVFDDNSMLLLRCSIVADMFLQFDSSNANWVIATSFRFG